MFGVVDLNGRWLDNNGVTQYSMSQDGLSPSRLGFRGVEDMGGGLKAGFWLEAPLNPDIGNASVRPRLHAPIDREPEQPVGRSCASAATRPPPTTTPATSTPSATPAWAPPAT